MRIVESLVASLIFLATTEPTEFQFKGNVFCEHSSSWEYNMTVLELDTIQNDLIYYKEYKNVKNESFSFWARRHQTTDGHFDNHFELATYLTLWCAWLWKINLTSPVIPASTELVDDLIYRYGYTNYTESVISFCTDIFQEDPFGDGWFDSHIEIGYRFYAWCGAYHVASWDSQPIRLKTRSYESFIYIEYNGHDYTTKHYALCDKFYC